VLPGLNTGDSVRAASCDTPAASRSARRRKRGLAILRPSDSTAKWARPRSIPVSAATTRSGSSPAWTTKLAKYRPAASRITVTDDGTAGSGRDQRTGTSPILGSRSFSPRVTAKRALRVNRMACRRSLRDRNLGGATFGPFRLPLSEAKKSR
jgi:hypothetical protein